MKTSVRVNQIKPAATRAITDLANAMKAKSIKTVSLAMGEPDFPTPQAGTDYAIKAMHNGHTHYTPTQGIVELRQEIANYYKQRFNLDFNTNEITTGTGAKLLVYEALGVLIDPGDEIIVITPAWVSYVEQIQLLNGVPVFVDTKDTGFEPTIEAIAKAVTAKTVGIIVNSPNNPSGKIYSDKFWTALCALAMEKDLVIINDEIYERLTYEDCYTNPLQLCPQAADHIITINGVSKSYAMTGWRLGFAIGSQALISKMIKFQGHLTSGSCSIAQWASVGAIREAQSEVEAMKNEYRTRRDFVLSRLAAMPHIKTVKPQGAFYVFPDITGCYGLKYDGQAIVDDTQFCSLLLETTGLALVPGCAFLCADHVRMSYATSMDELADAMDRLENFLTKLS